MVYPEHVKLLAVTFALTFMFSVIYTAITPVIIGYFCHTCAHWIHLSHLCSVNMVKPTFFTVTNDLWASSKHYIVMSMLACQAYYQQYCSIIVSIISSAPKNLYLFDHHLCYYKNHFT